MKSQNTLGQLAYDDFDRATLGPDWSVANIGGASAVISGNELLLSNGTALTTEYILYTAYTTCLENWRLYVPFKCTEKSATSSGFAIGLRGLTNAGGGQRTNFIQINLSTGGNGGKTFIETQTGASAVVLQATSAAIGFALNDEMALEVVRQGQTITCTSWNYTTPASVVNTFTYNTNAAAVPLHSTAQIPIYIIRGTQTIHSISFSSIEKQNPQMIMVGDSITYGAYPSSSTTVNTLRWSNQTMLFSSKPFVVLGGSGDTTSVIMQRTTEMVLLKPKYALFMFGGNDILAGVAAGTYQANYRTIRNTLTAAGIKVIHCKATPRTTTDITALNTWITSEYANVDFIVDTYTPLKGAGTSLSATYDSGDGVHPNAAGHALIGTTIRQTVPHIFN